MARPSGKTNAGVRRGMACGPRGAGATGILIRTYELGRQGGSILWRRPPAWYRADFGDLGIQAPSAPAARYFDRLEYRRVAITNETNPRYTSACWSYYLDSVRSGSVAELDVDLLGRKIDPST